MAGKNVRRVVVFLVATLSLLFALFGAAGAEASEQVFKWRMQSVDPPGMVGPEITQKAFCDRVREMSGGRLDITLYTAGQLTPTKEIVESLGAGTIDISYTTGAYYTGIVPEANLEQAGLPPLVLDSLRDAINLYWYGELGEIIREGYAKEGVYYLGAVPWEVPITFWSKEPMYGVDDLKGYKPRSFGYTAKTLAKLGASPAFLPHEEVYLSLAQGIINGSMTDGSYYERMKYYEVAPYYIVPGLSNVQEMCLLVSMKSWEALPDDLKAILREAHIHFSLDHGQHLVNAYNSMMAKMDELKSTVIVWPEEEQKKIRQAGLEFFPEIAAKSPGCARGIEILTQYLKEKKLVD